MSFLNPGALWAAAVFLPALVALYFLRLRRTEQVIGSTFLWRRSLEDLQVNSLFQKLRRNILLVLQLIFLALLVMVPAVPGCEAGEVGGRSVIIVIDNSASMATTDQDDPAAKTRLDAAKREAAKLLRGLWVRETADKNAVRERPPDEAMIIAFSDRAEIVAPFSRDIPLLERALATVSVRHTPTDLSAALELLRGQAENRRNPPHVYIFTDGKVGNSSELALQTESLTVVMPKGVPAKAADNLGVTLFSAMRTLGGESRIQAVAELVNSGDAPVKTAVRVKLEGRELPLGLPEVTVPGRGTVKLPDGSDGPGEAGLRQITFTIPGAIRVDGKPTAVVGALEFEIVRPDSLLIDNRAWDVVPPPHRPRGLLVTAGPTGFRESPVVRAVRALDFADFDVVTGGSFQMAAIEPGAERRYDVVIFDGVTPSAKPPPGCYLMLGVLPPYEDLKLAGEIGDPLVSVNWVDPRHTLTASAGPIGLDAVSIFKALDWTLPAGGTWLAEGVVGKTSVPLLAEFLRDGATFLIVGFAVNPRIGGTINTDWWAHPGFAVFMQKAVEYLGRSSGGFGDGSSGAGGRQIKPGRPIDLSVAADVTGGRLTDPDGQTHELTPAGGRLSFADTSRVGLYSLLPQGGGAAASTAPQRFAVNLFDRAESDIAPPSDGKVAIDHQPANVADELTEARTDGWRYLLWGALAILTLEWWIYNRKVHL